MSSRSGAGKRKLGAGEGSGFEGWGGYMQAKIQKLQDQFQEATPQEGSRKGQQTNIFNGVSIFVNGYTKPSSAELKTLMMQHGGIYHHYYQRPLVTHIIASNLPNSKVLNLTDKKVVSPDWIVDSIAAGRLLSHEPYLLYTSRSKTQPSLNKFSIKTRSKANLPEAASVGTDNSNETVGSPCEGEQVTVESADSHDKERQPALEVPMHGVSMDDSESTSSSTTNNSSTIASKTTLKANETVVIATGASPKGSGGGFRNIGDARDSNFLSEFFGNSRLHHIATWGAEYKAYVTKLQATGDTHFTGRDALREMVANRESSTESIRFKRLIMHVDMDCFFVSVGLRKRPDLVGKPVAVTHSRGKGAKERPGTDLAYEAAHWAKRKGRFLKKGMERGRKDLRADDLERNPDLLLMEPIDDDNESDDTESEGGQQLKPDPAAPKTTAEAFHSMSEIASCNYEARAAGVKNGMFMGSARSLCPQLETIPYDFDGYQQVSRLLYDTVASYTHDIEAVSCDEMFVDCTELLADTGASPEEFATLLRDQIRKATGCNASAGMGPNVLLARMATRVAKPNGQFLIREDVAANFIKDKPVKELPGVGYAMMNKLSAMSVSTCGELQQVALSKLQKDFGPKIGQSLYRFCRGQDDRPIKCDHERKSVSAEVNYGIRFTKESDVERFITELSSEVHSRLVKLNVKGKTISLKLKVRAEGAPKETAKFLGHGICDNVTKSVTIPMATDSEMVIAKEVMGIVKGLRIPPSEYRGVGIQISRLESPIEKRSTVKGVQSILNFATKSESSTENNCSLNSAASKHEDSTSSSVTLTSKACAPPSTSQSEEHFISNKKEVCPRVDSDEGQCLARDQDSQPAAVSASRRAVKVNLPPLPTLPSFLSPPPQAPPSRSEETPPERSLAENLLLPSPSQVDPDVLRELPPDIRAQIEGAMATKGRGSQRHHDNQSARRQTRSTAQPSLTGQSSVTDQATTTNRSVVAGQEDCIVALPALSQLDPSCLDALPDELREELAQAYQRDKGLNLRNQPSLPNTNKHQQLHPVMHAQRNSPKRSPGKASPSRKTRGSPSFKKPRGRGPGRPRKQLQFGTSTNISENKAKKVQDPPAHRQPSTSSVTPQEHTPSESQAGVASRGEHADGTASDTSAVSLCGAVTLTEVKDLLKEWTQSCEAPEETDISHLNQYLYDLVLDRDLERVDLVLKYFRRCVRSGEFSAKWEKSFKDVFNQTQTIVESIYGSLLQLR